MSVVFLSTAAAMGAASSLNDDVQCILVGARLSSSGDTSQQLAGRMFLVYFLGHVDGRWPGADLERLLNSETRKNNSSELDAIAKKCGARFSARGEYLVRIGKSLEQTAK